MTDKTTIEISVDTFTDRDSYFVRTEVEARTVMRQAATSTESVTCYQGVSARRRLSDRRVQSGIVFGLRS
jgi:hypothetical protein